MPVGYRTWGTDSQYNWPLRLVRYHVLTNFRQRFAYLLTLSFRLLARSSIHFFSQAAIPKV